MAQNAIALNGLNGESHEQFCRSVVPILVYLRAHANSNNPISVVPGIVTVSGGGFCHIIAYKGLLFTKNAHNYRYEIVFPNNMNVELEHRNIERCGLLAFFYCPIPIGIIDAVQFGNQITRNQKLKMYGYEIDNASGQLQNDLTDGYVTHVGNEYFGHDCTPSFFSEYGSPVFNEEKFVGISYKHVGVTEAFGVEYITTTLSNFYGGNGNMSMSEILQHIRGVGEQKFAQPEDADAGASL